MQQSSQSNKHFTDEYKKQAVQLAERLGSIPEACKKLGLRESTLYGWRAKHPEWSLKPDPKAVDMAAEMAALKEENRRLKKENTDLNDANYILKRAAIFFSQDLRKPGSSF